MVADGVHIVLGVAVVVAAMRPRDPEPYVVAVLATAIPDLDKFVLPPLLYSGVVSGPAWTHRGVTHSLFAIVLFVALAALVGQWRPALLAFGSHVVADAATGGVRFFAPVSIRTYGFHYDWIWSNLVAGGAAVVVLVGWLFVLATDVDPRTVLLRATDRLLGHDGPADRARND